MPSFTYLAKEKNGASVAGKLEGINQAEILSLLLEKGLTPIKIGPPQKKKSLSFAFGKKVPVKQKVVFIRQLATLINAGIPLAGAFDILQRQTANQAFNKIIATVSKDLQGGISLSDGLGKHPQVFDPIFVNMIRAGETGGTLDQTLERLAGQMEKDREIVSKVKGALTYPAVIFVAMVGAVIFLMVKIVPEISKVFDDMGGQLPINTRILIALSNAFTNYFIYILIISIVAGFGIKKIIKKSDKAKYFISKMLLKIPIINNMVVKFNTARFTRILGSLLTSGIPVIDSVDIVARSLTNRVFKEKLLATKAIIKNGQPISAALEKTELFPALVTEMISVGEETGSLDEILLKIADFHDKELDSIISNISSIIEPVIMIVLGGIIGFIVISILQPIYTLSDVI